MPPRRPGERRGSLFHLVYPHLPARMHGPAARDPDPKPRAAVQSTDRRWSAAGVNDHQPQRSCRAPTAR